MPIEIEPQLLPTRSEISARTQGGYTWIRANKYANMFPHFILRKCETGVDSNSDTDLIKLKAANSIRGLNTAQGKSVSEIALGRRLRTAIAVLGLP